MTETPWMTVAEYYTQDEPIIEVSGRRTNPLITEMYRLCGVQRPEDLDDSVWHWCAAAVGACLALGGYANTRSLLARSYLETNVPDERRISKPLDAPRPGCIAVLQREGDPSKGHVGFFVREEGDRIVLLGGNQGDRMCERRFPKTQVLEYRWPIRPAPVPASSMKSIAVLAPAAIPAFLRPPEPVEAEPGTGPLPEVPTTPHAAASTATVTPKFLRCQEVIKRWEGGWSNDARDPGGATKYGITIHTLRAVRGPQVTVEDVRRLTYDDALDIYARNYWNPVKAEEMPEAVSLVVYNASVNSGPKRAALFLQRALNRELLKVDVDGEVGPKTVAAVKQADPGRLVEQFCSIQQNFYEGLPTFDRFGRGWLNRLSDVKRQALAVAPAPPAELPSAITLSGASTMPATADATSNASTTAGVGHPLTTIDKVTGGSLLAGKKTLIGGIGVILSSIAGAFTQDGKVLSDIATPETMSAVQSAFAGLTALGIGSKLERWLPILVRVLTAIPK